MPAPSDFVLITGATGFLGYSVLVEALKKGYQVRMAVRSEAKAKKVIEALSTKGLTLSKDQLTWVIVPDMAAPDAYDEAVKDVKYIIHVASPIPTFGGPNPPPKEKYEEWFIKPAMAGDIGMLKSAAKEASVKRVVLTSSTVAITPFEYYMGKGDYSRVFKASDRIDFDQGPYELEFQAYSAGKGAALKAAEDFVRDNKPGFDLIPIIPSWIFGHDELCTKAEDMKAESTNSVLLKFLTGFQNPVPYNGNVVLGQDVAKIHVLALEPKIEGNRAYLASTATTWEDAKDILKNKYSDAVADGHLSLEGKQDTVHMKIPASETEEIFGLKLQPFETMVTQVVDQYLALSKA
jgi:nucleoside-diphosphate-sugar epimerase